MGMPYYVPIAKNPDRDWPYIPTILDPTMGGNKRR